MRKGRIRFHHSPGGKLIFGAWYLVHRLILRPEPATVFIIHGRRGIQTAFKSAIEARALNSLPGDRTISGVETPDDPMAWNDLDAGKWLEPVIETRTDALLLDLIAEQRKTNHLLQRLVDQKNIVYPCTRVLKKAKTELMSLRYLTAVKMDCIVCQCCDSGFDHHISEIELSALERPNPARGPGVDLTRINGLGLTAAMKILTEIGPDLSRFASVKHFCSWLGLCPGTKISGGKVLSAKTKRSTNRVRQALKMAAMSLAHSESALGGFYRRMCARMDKPSANTAVAHKLARMVYFMMTRGEAFVDQGQQRYEDQQHQRSVAALKRRATALGFVINPVTAAV